LTGERIHDKCFFCGPNGAHYQPPLPPYPQEWDYFIDDRKTVSISCKPNNIFSLTTIGVYNGDFMKFPDGVAAVTLSSGRTYHQMLPAHEGQHAIHWFIHDPWAMFSKAAEMAIPDSWINSTLAGLDSRTCESLALDFFWLLNVMSLTKLAAFTSKLLTVQIGSCALSSVRIVCGEDKC
jgi:hypothetical protein